MSNKHALIVWGGWEGHEPQQVAEIFHKSLSERGFDVTVETTLDAFKNEALMRGLDLVVPIWTMGTLAPEQERPLLDAVKRGAGIAGCHGGMCDAFRMNTEYQFMTGGQWVAHPGDDGIDYTVRITQPDHFITQGSPTEFAVSSEQYYMHTDPGNNVLAVTQFPVADGPHVKNGLMDMPVIWTKYYGEGRVAFNSLGHHADIVVMPAVHRLMTRALLWAAHAEDRAD